MNSFLEPFLSGLAGLLFIVAAILAIRPLRWTLQRGQWITLVIVFFTLASVAGLRVYQQITLEQTNSFDLIFGALSSLAALLACGATYTAGSRAYADHLTQAATLAELERYRHSFEKEPQILAIKDRQGNYLTANLAYAAFLGEKEQDLVGKSDFNFLSSSQALSFRQEEEKALESGVPQTRDEEIRGVDEQHWFRITRLPLLDDSHSIAGIIVSGQEITAQKEAEASLVEWKQGLTTLIEAEMGLKEPDDLAVIWKNILSWAGRLANTSHVGLWQVIPDTSTAVLKAGCGKLERLLDVQLVGGESIVWKVWQSGQPVMANDYPLWPEHGQWAQEAGFCAAAGLPLKVSAQVSYVVTLFYDKPEQAFRDVQTQLLSLFTRIASSKLQTTELLTAGQNEREERKQALAKFQYRVRLEHIVAVIATHFITLDTSKIDEGINRSLQTVARFAGIDQSYLVLFPREGSAGQSNPAYYSSNNIETSNREQEDYTRDEFQWYLNKINQSEIIHIPRLAELSPDNEEAAGYLQSREIKSFTAIPLVSNRSVIGYLALEAQRDELEWSQEILALLKVCADMFVNLLERKWAALAVKEAQDKVKDQIHTLEHSNRESALITEMGDLLQACRTADEAYPIITRYVQRLIQAGSGALYLIRDTQDPAENVAAWGTTQPGPAEHEMALNECWSLRRGRIYVVQDPATEPLCGHLKDPIHTGYMCVPLIAQGMAVGVLHLRQQSEAEPFNESQQRLAVKVAEYIAMALTNLKLRDELRSQAIRDPLTGLFNRRYMEETLEREIRRANRHATSVGIIMFDIDKMKPINDRYGHDAGDLVLKTLGNELLRMFRGEDVACRYGGDEFTIVLPEASLADVWQRAEQMREAMKRIDLQYEGKQLGALTLSIGVAAYPDHGATTERVLLACDAASYASKSEGGDRIMMGHKAET